MYLYPYLIGVSCFLIVCWMFGKPLKLKRFGKRIDKIPGPFSVPILGTLAVIVIPRTEILDVLVRWANKFKGCFRVWLLNEPMIFVSSPNYVQKILGSKEHLEKSEIYNVLKHLLGQGLITAEVPTWKLHRKMLISSVNGKMVDIFTEICNLQLKTFQEVLDKVPSIGNAHQESRIQTNLHPIINRLAFDIICEAIFGKSQDTLINSNSYYLETGFKNKVVCSKRWFNPFLRWRWVWAIHPLRKYEQAIMDVADELFNSVVGDRRKLRTEVQTSKMKYDANTNDVSSNGVGFKVQKRSDRGALIDTLLDAQCDPANEITDEYMKNELMTFLVAGHDTSAETILWVLFMLGNHPEIQEKVHNELIQVFGDNRQPEMSLEDLNKLTYLEQCIKETLRLYPSVPLMMRKVHSDIELEPGLIIPSGSDVGISVSSVHQNPIIYPNPKKFDPDRFSSDKIAERHPYAFCPFSLGPRNCIGKRLGEVLSKSVLAQFFLNFSLVSLKTPEEVKTVAEVTLGPSEPIYFYVNKR